MVKELIRVGRPNAIGSRKDEVISCYNTLYDNWRLVWDVNGRSAALDEALVLYDEAYEKYFSSHPQELEWIAKNYSDVYDNNVSNTESGCDYAIQEFGGNHYQDIAIRRCLARRGMWFEGTDLLEIRASEPGVKWGPGNIPFHLPQLIPQPELKGWWNKGSLESWYQSARYLEADNPLPYDCMYFVTSNSGKFHSAQMQVPDFKLTQLALPISETQSSIKAIARHKARVAYAATCRSVVCDDSGFFIPAENKYPGHKVGREIESRGISHFLDIAKKHGGSTPAYFEQVLAYFDESLASPKLFTSRTDGILLDHCRGELHQKHIKSSLFGSFIPIGIDKTLAEMTVSEFKEYAQTDRWSKLTSYLTTEAKKL